MQTSSTPRRPSPVCLLRRRECLRRAAGIGSRARVGVGVQALFPIPRRVSCSEFGLATTGWYRVMIPGLILLVLVVTIVFSVRQLFLVSTGERAVLL